jgi:hypothetical protein
MFFHRLLSGSAPPGQASRFSTCDTIWVGAAIASETRDVDCSPSPATCFAETRARDFSRGALLAGLGQRWTAPWAPVQDFFRTPRSRPPAVGAVASVAACSRNCCASSGALPAD